MNYLARSYFWRRSVSMPMKCLTGSGPFATPRVSLWCFVMLLWGSGNRISDHVLPQDSVPYSAESLLFCTWRFAISCIVIYWHGMVELRLSFTISLLNRKWSVGEYRRLTPESLLTFPPGTSSIRTLPVLRARQREGCYLIYRIWNFIYGRN